MTFVNNATYQFINRADSNRSLNVYGTKPTSTANVCLYTSDKNDICQQWVYKKNGSNEYFVCKGNQNLALDLYTGSSVSSAKDINAHVYAPSSTSYVKIESVSGDYVKIKLVCNGKYLTANKGSNGTANGISASAAGNVYFKNHTTDYSQDWKAVRLDGGSTPDPKPGEYDKNYLIYPTKTMNITQNYNDGNHYDCSHGNPVDYPIDEACEDTGRSWFYCPCDEMVVKRIYTSGTNTIWFESTSPVVTPSGAYDKISIMVMHPNDNEISALKNQYFTRGQAMFREGDDGAPNNNHFHISVGTGSYNGGVWNNGWYGPKGDNKQYSFTPTDKVLKPEEAFYVDTTFTTIKNSKGINFENI